MTIDLQSADAQSELADRARRERIDQALAKSVNFGAGCPPRLAEAIRYALLSPGKRLRPILVLLAAEACGGREEDAMPAAVAVEMIHAYSLVHDDLPAMDDDDLRRGRPTCHKQYDEATAILVGDALQMRAIEILAAGGAGGAAAIAELSAAAGAEALVGGQAADLAAEQQEIDLAELESIHRRKTGALFLASVRLGGLAAGAAPEQMAALTTYGKRLGLAFQVVDDLLDVSGSEAQMGKKVGKDHRHGKGTYPVLLGVDASRQRAAQLIEDARCAVKILGAAGAPLIRLAEFVGRRNC